MSYKHNIKLSTHTRLLLGPFCWLLFEKWTLSRLYLFWIPIINIQSSFVSMFLQFVELYTFTKSL